MCTSIKRSTTQGDTGAHGSFTIDIVTKHPFHRQLLLKKVITIIIDFFILKTCKICVLFNVHEWYVFFFLVDEIK